MEHQPKRGDVNNQGPIEPQFEAVMRRASQLAGGEVAIEPALGPARVVGVAPAPDGSSFINITWRDDFGPCTAAARYPLAQTFPVRVPARGDQWRIGQAIGQTARSGRDIEAEIARLIAGHLHRGPSTALFCPRTTSRVGLRTT